MKKLLILVAALFCYSVLIAQEKDVHISLEAQGITTTNDAVPFWLRSNQFGSIPLKGSSGSIIGSIRKDYDSTKTYGWGASFEGRANLGNNTRFDLIEGFVKARAGVFEIKAGRSKDIIGIVDSTLSSGSFPVSGNALGIPKVKIGIPGYYSLPVFGKLFAVKTTLAAGYAGNVAIDYTNAKTNQSKSYYLEDQLYVKVGMPAWRFKLQVGFNHEVLWGDEKKVFGSYRLSGSETLWYVLSGKTYHSSKVGNHLGSLDVGAEYRFDNATLLVYRQNFYDKGGLASLANIADGLNGLSITNNKSDNSNFSWRKIVAEFLYTANQAGKLSSKKTKSGYENYYNNYEYNEGWSYKGLGLGTPFITTVGDARSGLASYKKEYFINTRVKAYHIATQVYAYKWLYTLKVSYSNNLGNYITGPDPFKGTGSKTITPGAFGLFKPVNQLSTYFEAIRPLKNQYNIGCDVGYDHGGLLYNSFGLIVKVSKNFL
jgi:hypothetical protein